MAATQRRTAVALMALQHTRSAKAGKDQEHAERAQRAKEEIALKDEKDDESGGYRDQTVSCRRLSQRASRDQQHSCYQCCQHAVGNASEPLENTAGWIDVVRYGCSCEAPDEST